MTTLTILGHSDWGYVYGNNATWSTCRSTSTAFHVTATAMTLGQTTGYYTWRNFLRFDTSAIPAGAVVSSLKLRLTVTTQHASSDAVYLRIYKYDWSAYVPIAAGNREAVYDDVLGSVYDNSLASAQINNQVVGTQALSEELDITNLNLSGYTYYGLLGNRDVNDSYPPGGDNRWYVGTPSNATDSNKPALVIEYTSGIAGVKTINGVADWKTINGVAKEVIASIQEIT